jgi:hypothetical protein
MMRDRTTETSGMSASELWKLYRWRWSRRPWQRRQRSRTSSQSATATSPAATSAGADATSSDASRATTNQTVFSARLARSARPFPAAAIFPAQPPVPPPSPALGTPALPEFRRAIAGDRGYTPRMRPRAPRASGAVPRVPRVGELPVPSPLWRTVERGEEGGSVRETEERRRGEEETGA